MNAYDIETYLDETNTHIPYCVCFKINNDYGFFYGENAVKDSILAIINKKKKKKIFIYIHNLNFDGFFILSYLSESLIKFDVFIRDLNIYSIKIIIDNFNIIDFRCSFKLLPASLKKIATTFSLENKKIFPYKFASCENLYYTGAVPNREYFNSIDDYVNFTKKNIFFDFKAYSLLYCKTDVEITAAFVQKLQHIIKKFEVKLESTYSAPSLAFMIFKKKFNKKKIEFKMNQSTYNFIRNAYYGGRCEVYGNPYEGEHVHHFDFSGMYGACMREKLAYGRYYFKISPVDTTKPGFYCIKFYSNMDHPVLPHKSIKTQKLMFTNGIIVGFYWFEEINLFLEMGGVLLEIYYGVLYEEYGDVFSEYVEYFNEIKHQGLEYKTFGKLMINSLYGRLGMDDNNKYTFFIKKKNIDEYEKKYIILKKKQLNDLILIEIELNKKEAERLKLRTNKIQSNIGIAAAITAKARIKLYRAHISVINNNGRLLYSDTDSIYAAFSEDVSNIQCGEIVWDKYTPSNKIIDCVFINPKTYAIKTNEAEIIKIKGLNEKNFTYDTIKKKFYNNENLHIHNFMYITREDFNYRNIYIDKNFNFQNYNKRKFDKNLKSTKPYTYVNNDYE